MSGALSTKAWLPWSAQELTQHCGRRFNDQKTQRASIKPVFCLQNSHPCLSITPHQRGPRIFTSCQGTSICISLCNCLFLSFISSLGPHSVPSFFTYMSGALPHHTLHLGKESMSIPPLCLLDLSLQFLPFPLLLTALFYNESPLQA